MPSPRDPHFEPSNILADYLLAEARERGELLTPLKLQKLMYYADAWHMALNDDALTPEGFQAWVHGPVALSQFHRFKEYKWRAISEEIERPLLAVATAQHLNDIMDVFGTETAVALELMTHQELPWIEARGGLPPDASCNTYISKDTTREYYRQIAQAA